VTSTSRDRDYFDGLYARDPDPWRFATSAYEAAKYAATVAAVGDLRYRAGLEVGCSIGVLSAQLAPLCDSFLGLDISEKPLEAARERCAGIASARFLCGRVPADWPEGGLDLVIFSEVLYFLSAKDIRATAARVRASLLPRGRVLLVNWLGSEETPQPGDLAAEQFLSALALPVTQAARHSLYRLDLATAPGEDRPYQGTVWPR
jgi:2-polyprenyl-3-methyl-5-hydroxy-6-metoxy-1,4-benzoquinol methylase